jgi:hypothetical protein
MDFLRNSMVGFMYQHVGFLDPEELKITLKRPSQSHLATRAQKSSK